MRADPVRQRLGPACFRVGVVRRAERRDKDAGTTLGARDGITSSPTSSTASSAAAIAPKPPAVMATSVGS